MQRTFVVGDTLPEEGIRNSEGGYISKDYKLIRTLGGSQIVHTRDCPYIQNYNLTGMEEIFKFKHDKMRTCSCCCGKYVYIASVADDYLEHSKEYHRIFENVPLYTIKKLFHDKARIEMEICNNRLYIHSGKDNWFVDYSMIEIDEVHLFHNNYNQRIRKTGNAAWKRNGFHEQRLRGEGNSMSRAIYTIATYSYKAAQMVHDRKWQERLFRMRDGVTDQDLPIAQ